MHVRKRALLSLTVLAVVTAMVLGVAGCSKGGKEGAITLGIPIPLSGVFGVYGEAMKQATELAVSEINASGGLLGREVKVVYGDTQSDVQPTIDVVKSLIEKDNVDALIGIISSANRDAVIPTVFRAKKILIYPTTYEGGVAANFHDTGARYVFTTGPVSEQYIKPFIPWIIENRGDSFYLLGMDYIYGTGSIANAKQYIAEAGGTVVGEEYIPFGTTDFSAVLNRIAAAKPEVVFAVIAGDDLVYLVKQFHEFGLKDQGIAFTTSELDESYLQALGAEAAEGIACSYPYFMQVQNPQNEAFLAKMRAAYGDDVLVSLAHESQYYSIWLYANAVEAAGTVETEAVIAALEEAQVDAPQGLVSIRKTDHQAIVGDVIAVVEPDPNKPYWEWLKIVDQTESIEPALQGDIYGGQ
ncbi:MAG: hypothetical protein C4551_03040 [Bacillota bacterium]|nr:MAG: hypothetical protein C4551_03040 [Bacillota bacterium]